MSLKSNTFCFESRFVFSLCHTDTGHLVTTRYIIYLHIVIKRLIDLCFIFSRLLGCFAYSLCVRDNVDEHQIYKWNGFLTWSVCCLADFSIQCWHRITILRPVLNTVNSDWFAYREINRKVECSLPWLLENLIDTCTSSYHWPSAQTHRQRLTLGEGYRARSIELVRESLVFSLPVNERERESEETDWIPLLLSHHHPVILHCSSEDEVGCLGFSPKKIIVVVCELVLRAHIITDAQISKYANSSPVQRVKKKRSHMLRNLSSIHCFYSIVVLGYSLWFVSYWTRNHEIDDDHHHEYCTIDVWELISLNWFREQSDESRSSTGEKFQSPPDTWKHASSCVWGEYQKQIIELLASKSSLVRASRLACPKTTYRSWFTRANCSKHSDTHTHTHRDDDRMRRRRKTYPRQSHERTMSDWNKYTSTDFDLANKTIRWSIGFSLLISCYDFNKNNLVDRNMRDSSSCRRHRYVTGDCLARSTREVFGEHRWFQSDFSPPMLQIHKRCKALRSSRSCVDSKETMDSDHRLGWIFFVSSSFVFFILIDDRAIVIMFTRRGDIILIELVAYHTLALALSRARALHVRVQRGVVSLVIDTLYSSIHKRVVRSVISVGTR